MNNFWEDTFQSFNAIRVCVIIVALCLLSGCGYLRDFGSDRNNTDFWGGLSKNID